MWNRSLETNFVDAEVAGIKFPDGSECDVIVQVAGSASFIAVVSRRVHNNRSLQPTTRTTCIKVKRMIGFQRQAVAGLVSSVDNALSGENWDKMK